MVLVLLLKVDRFRQHPPECYFVAVRQDIGTYAVDCAGLLISNAVYTDFDKLPRGFPGGFPLLEVSCQV